MWRPIEALCHIVLGKNSLSKVYHLSALKLSKFNVAKALLLSGVLPTMLGDPCHCSILGEVAAQVFVAHVLPQATVFRGVRRCGADVNSGYVGPSTPRVASHPHGRTLLTNVWRLTSASPVALPVCRDFAQLHLLAVDVVWLSIEAFLQGFFGVEGDESKAARSRFLIKLDPTLLGGEPVNKINKSLSQLKLPIDVMIKYLYFGFR